MFYSFTCILFYFIVFCLLILSIGLTLKFSSHFIANGTWHDALVAEIFAIEPPPGVDSTYFYIQLHNWVMWNYGFDGYYHVPARWEYIDSHWNHNPARWDIIDGNWVHIDEQWQFVDGHWHFTEEHWDYVEDHGNLTHTYVIEEPAHIEDQGDLPAFELPQIFNMIHNPDPLDINNASHCYTYDIIVVIFVAYSFHWRNLQLFCLLVYHPLEGENFYVWLA